MIVGRLGAAGGLLLQEKRGEEVLGEGEGTCKEKYYQKVMHQFFPNHQQKPE